MRVESITVRGFRCFDAAGETIKLNDITCFVGPNASGKTAGMMALARLFGESGAQRQIVPADFHLGVGEDLRSKSPRTLVIESRLAFPELEGVGNDVLGAVPATFNQMLVDEPGGTPYCRIRLEATWTDDGTSEGNIEQAIWWILTSSDDPQVVDNGNRHRVLPGARGRVRVVYVPAARDPDYQVRATTATIFGRLLRALDWSGQEESLNEKLLALQKQVAELLGVRTLNSQVQSSWQRFYSGFPDR